MPDRPKVGYVLLIASGWRLRAISLPSRGLLTLGRSRRSDIHVSDKLVSAHHALLAVGSELTITDLCSRNGTLVRDRAIAPLQATVIQPGEAVRIGDTFLFLEGGLDQERLARTSNALFGQFASQDGSLNTGESDYSSAAGLSLLNLCW